MTGDYSRREFVSLLGSAAASALAACGGATSPTKPEPSEPKQETGPGTYIVEKQEANVVAREKATGNVVARGTNARKILQAAVDDIERDGTVHVKAGTYLIQPPRLELKSNITFEGEGTEETVLKLPGGLNGQASDVLALPQESRNTTLHRLAIDGNESENRDINPFPDSPHVHGLVIWGSDHVIEDVFVHDTIRSNVVLEEAENCDLTALRLKNSVTDHWLYVAGGNACTIKDVHASGFARGSGVVFGVGERMCRKNTLSNVIIEEARPTPIYDPDNDRIHDHYPVNALNMRAVPNAAKNTVEDMAVRSPHPDFGQVFNLGQKDTRVKALDYRGPVGGFAGQFRVGFAEGAAPGATVSDVTIQATDVLTESPPGPGVVVSQSSDVVLENITVKGTEGPIRGVVFRAHDRKVADNELRQAEIESSVAAISANGQRHPVSNLKLKDVTDVRCSGVSTNGDVSFAKKDVECVTFATIVVFKEDGTVKAKAQDSGKIIAEDSEARDVIQSALDRAEPEGGTVHLRKGIYTVPSEPRLAVVKNGVELKGDGVGKSVLKLANEVNEDAGTVLWMLSEGATVRDLEIDGNESSNRDIPSYPDSPPGHGIIVRGKKNKVKNVYAHDTIRSNVVLNGKQCELSDLRLENAATDHWLYITDGQNCTVKNVHASGFARGSGITFGVGERTCHDNVVENVTIEGATPHPDFDPETAEHSDIAAHYPFMAIIWRGAENTRDNTVRNITIRDPHPTYGHTLKLRHPGAALRGLSYEGPVGFWPEFLTIGGPDNLPHATGHAPAGQFVDGIIKVTEAIDEGAARPVVVESASTEVTCENVTIQNAVGASLQGISLEGEFRPVENNTFRQVSIESSGAAIVADGRDHPIRNLLLGDVTDVRCTGIETKGEVTFADKDVTCS